MNLDYSRECLKRLSRAKEIEGIREFLSGEDAGLIRRQAERLKQNIFLFDKPWDMERCLIPYRVAPLDFNAQRNGDEEWCFMLNRMDYLSYLMLSGVMGDEAGYVAGLNLIEAWAGSHPVIEQGPSARTLDTGIRIMNIMEALPFLLEAGQLEDECLCRILKSLRAQIDYLKKEYLPKYTLSNWGSIQTCAILSVLPLLSGDYEKDPIFVWAQKELETQFSIQIYEDGMQWEQSAMYHIEVLNYGMKAVYYQRFYGFAPLETAERRCAAMMEALLYQMTPDRQIEAFGDSDRVGISDIFVRGSVLFKHKLFRWAAGEQFDLESLYSLGAAGRHQFDALLKQEPERLNYDGRDSGMYCMRTGWEAKAGFTMFTHGSLGSGHGHSDNLHLSVYYGGEPFLIDSGRFTYREDHPVREALKRMTAHNCVLIDEKEYCLPKGSWGYEAFGLPLKAYVRHEGPFHYLEGTMIGSDPLQVWTRKLVVLPVGIWVIADEVRQDGAHRMKQYFHLDPAKRGKRKGDGWLIRGKEAALCLRGEGRPGEDIKPCSLRYNELLDHQVLTLEKDFTDRGTAVVCLTPEGIKAEKAAVLQNLDTPAAEDLAQARTFRISETESYTVVLFHRELYQGKKICSCAGMPFHAKAAVIHEKNGEKNLWRLKV